MTAWPFPGIISLRNRRKAELMWKLDSFLCALISQVGGEHKKMLVWSYAVTISAGGQNPGVMRACRLRCKIPSEHILWIGEPFDKQLCQYKGWFVWRFLVWAAPINMHCNLAQGVICKGYPITSQRAPLKTSRCCGRCSFHPNFLVILFYFTSFTVFLNNQRRAGNLVLHLLSHSKKEKRINTYILIATSLLQYWLSIW